MYGIKAIEEEIAAPTAPNSGIKIKLKTIFNKIATDIFRALFFANPQKISFNSDLTGIYQKNIRQLLEHYSGVD